MFGWCGACRSWFATARRLVDMDWYRCNIGRDTRLINGCGPTPENVRGSKGRNAQRRGFLSEDSCWSSERVSATTTTSMLDVVHSCDMEVTESSQSQVASKTVKVHEEACVQFPDPALVDKLAEFHNTQESVLL